MSEPPIHTYPKGWEPGQHWAVTEAWAILDTLAPGALESDVRAIMAGMIIGTRLRLTGQTLPMPQEGGATP